MNLQEPESRVEALSLQVHSIFHTIQGEGPYAGYPAVFIRLAGCNLQCPQCDTEYTEKRSTYYPPELVKTVEQFKPRFSQPLIVISGGEPFRQALGLSRAVVYLLNAGWRVQIETNGTLPPIHLDSRAEVVVSPKTPAVNRHLYPFLKAVKYVLNARDVDPTDGLPVHALDHPGRGRVWRRPAELARLPVYIQPVDSEDIVANTKAAVESSMKYGYILCLQIHKILNLE